MSRKKKKPRKPLPRPVRKKPSRKMEQAGRCVGEALQYQRAGHYQRAEELYRQALEFSPRHADALHYLGLVLWQTGRIEDAIDAVSRSIQQDPGNAVFHNNLGLVLKSAGRLREAEDCHRKALHYKPGFAQAYFNLGVVLQDREDYPAAAEAYRSAIDSNAGFAKAHFNLGTVLKQEGDLETAVDSFEAALALDSRLYDAYWNLATAKKFSRDDQRQIDAMEAALERTGPGTDAAELLHFSLGKIYDDCGDYERAFGHYHAGNSLVHEHTRYDPRETKDLIDRLIAGTGKQLFKQHAGTGHCSEQPVFIVGMPRSGTTLVEQIIASHSRVFGAGELPYMEKIAASVTALLDTEKSSIEGVLDRNMRERLGNDYLERLAAPDCLRVTDKMPGNFLHLGLVRLIFPRARIIHCIRDRLDTCLSIYFQKFTYEVPYAWKLEDIADYYRNYQRLMDHWRDVLPGPLLHVNYADLIEHQEKTSRDLLDFCGLDWEPGCLRFHETARAIHTNLWQVRQPIYSDSLLRWKHYEKYLAPLMG